MPQGASLGNCTWAARSGRLHRLRTPRPSYRPPKPPASWRSGYAADCKSVYTGSIPVLASKKSARPADAATAVMSPFMQNAFHATQGSARPRVGASAGRGLRFTVPPHRMLIRVCRRWRSARPSHRRCATKHWHASGMTGRSGAARRHFVPCCRVRAKRRERALFPAERPAAAARY